MSMKLKIDTTNKQGISNQLEIIQKIKESVELTLKTGERHEVPSINLSSEASDLVVTEVNKIHGVKRASYGTLSHECGLGGMYGTGLTIYLDDSKMPTIQWQDDGNYLVNVHDFLKQFTVSESLTQVMDVVCEQDLDKMLAFLDETFGIELKGDNTYNYSSDFTQDFNFWSSGIESCESGGKALVLIAIHQGGDVRGNYADYVAYSMDYDEYCNFLTFHFGFYNEKHDHYTAGYTSEPQYHFLNDWTVLKIDKVKNEVKAKNKKTGEVAIFSTEGGF